MATRIDPGLATSGACDCCPRWLNDCCPYDVCGMPSRLIASTTSGGTSLFTGDGISWTGAFWHIAEDVPEAISIRIALECVDGNWQMSLSAGYGIGTEIGTTEQALTYSCGSPFSATFLFSGLEFAGGLALGDIAVTVSEEAGPPCYACCCFGAYNITLEGPIEFANDDCVHCPTLAPDFTFTPREDIEGVLCLHESELASFLEQPEIVDCICPTSDEQSHIRFLLWFEPYQGGCRAVIKAFHTVTCEAPTGTQSIQLALWKSEKIEGDCADTYGDQLTLSIVEANSLCDPQDTLTISLALPP